MSDHPHFVLLGTVNSYFTAKVRGYLVWRGLDFIEVPPHAELYKEFLQDVLQVRQIPVLIDKRRNEAVVDTSCILDYCEEHYRGSGRSFLPDGPTQQVLSYVMETFADEWMKFPAMHYRWSFPEQREFLKADWGHQLYPELHPTERENLVAQNMGFFGGMLPNLGVSAESAPGVEQATAALFEALSEHLKDHDFLFGPHPTLGDFAMAGPMHAHIYRDPIPGSMLKLKFPFVAHWVERTMGLNSRRDGVRWVAGGPSGVKAVVAAAPNEEAFAGDSIPETLQAVLRVVMAEHVPILKATLGAVDAFLSRRDAVREGRSPLPRMIGRHRVKVGNATGMRSIFPMELWKLHRASTCFRALGAAQQGEVGRFCEGFENGGDLVELLRRTPELHMYHGTKLFLKPQPQLQQRARL